MRRLDLCLWAVSTPVENRAASELDWSQAVLMAKRQW